MARKFITGSLTRGDASRQAHCDLPAGTFEREMSKEGFFGPAAFFHHRHPPTGWVAFEGPLRPRAFDLASLTGATPPFDAPVILRNPATEIRMWRLDAAMTELARDADGDLVLFVHAGAGDLHCDFGHLAVRAGDYLVVPRGTMWRIEPSSPLTILMIEATGSSITLPERGLLGPHALFDPAVMDVPDIDAAFTAQAEAKGAWTVTVKRRGQLSRITFPHNPLDVVGWHGELAVWRLNIADLRPVMSHRYHLPPSAHTTFLADRFVICTFCPRPFETDPGALKVPFFHSNDDYDEVLFYHAGDFFSRDNIHPGMMTFHPSGFVHGPHPKALTRMFAQPKAATDEYAVMIDTRDPLEVVEETARACEWPGYVDSWRTPAP